MLLTAVACTEDAAKYRGPVTFYTGQLLPVLGFAKWERLDAARKAAMAAGWLHYDQPPKGAHKAGTYWVTVPSSAEGLPDNPLDDGGDAITEAYDRGYDDGAAGRPKQPYPSAGDRTGSPYPSHGYSEGDRQGYRQGDREGEPPILPLNLSLSSPPPSGEGAAHSRNKAGTKRDKLKFTSEDRSTAEWFWSRIHELQSNRKAPSLDKWANEIRMMRELDGRTHSDIRLLFERVQRDTFWRNNVLCPEKLREKWDDLQLRLNSTAAPSNSRHRSSTPAKVPPRVEARVQATIA